MQLYEKMQSFGNSLLTGAIVLCIIMVVAMVLVTRKKHSTARQTEKLIKVPLSVQDTIPINRIAEDGIFELENKKGPHQFDQVYLFTDLNYVTKDEYEKEAFKDEYEKLLNSMNCNFKIILSTRRASDERLRKMIIRRAIRPEMEELARQYNDLETRRAQEANYNESFRYLVVTCEEENYEQAKIYFEQLKKVLDNAFDRLGSHLIPLNAAERLYALHSFYRMGQSDEFDFDWEEYLSLARDWRNDIINTSMRITSQKIYCEEDSVMCCMFARKIRNSTTDEFVRQILNLEFPLTFTIDVSPIDPDIAFDMVHRKYMNNDIAINKEQEHKNEYGQFSTDISYMNRKRQQTMEEILDKISSYDESLCYVGFYFLLKADNEEQMRLYQDKLRQIGKPYNIDIAVYSERQLDAMNTALPTGGRYIEIMRTMTTKELSIFIPFFVHEINEPDSFIYGRNQYSGQLIRGNRKALDSGNGLIFAKTGSGKSMFVKFLIGQVAAFTNDLIMTVDPMGEYKGMADQWGATYLNLSQSEKNAYFLNPFHVPERISDREDFYAQKAEFAFVIAEQAVKPHEFTNHHLAILDHAVKLEYDHYFEKVDKSTGKEEIPSPTIASIRECIINSSDRSNEAKELVDNLKPFAHGTLDIFSHQQTTSQTNKRMMIFGFPDLTSKMRTMAMLIMVETIASQIKYNQAAGEVTWLYIDEFHELLGDPYAAEYMEKLWREIRKRGGIPTGITQTVKDALKNETTETIVTNSDFVVLLNQGETDEEQIEQLFHLSQEQMRKISGAAPGTGLLKFGNQFVAFDNKMDKDLELYRLYNTNFHEINKEKQNDGTTDI